MAIWGEQSDDEEADFTEEVIGRLSEKNSPPNLDKQSIVMNKGR